MNTFLWLLVVFWAAVYGFDRFKSRNSSRLILPISGARHRRSKSKIFDVNVRSFHLQVRTHALNDSYDDLVKFFEINAGIKRLVRRFYDVGIVFGVVGFLAGIPLLGFNSAQFLTAWFSSREYIPRETFIKRDITIMNEVDTAEETYLSVDPIIPGVTVPWSHLPPILSALFFSQCFHEAGHAIAGAIEGLSLQAIGASLTVILPSAFVSFSSSMDVLTEDARMRVVAAGVWHNLILWTFLYLASLANFTSVWMVLGWLDISELGLAVINVEDNSPLSYHIPAGSIIRAIDDLSFGSNDLSSQDSWSQYLLGTRVPYEQGWCIDVDSFFDRPTSCCDRNAAANVPVHPPTAQLSCFVLMQDGDQGRCVDPVPLLISSPGQRCYSTFDCNGIPNPEEEKKTLKECIRPEESTELLRIKVSPPLWEMTEGDHIHDNGTGTVLWSGPRAEVWHQVKVGVLSPRYRLLPLWFPGATSVFLNYLSTISLSLYIFNLFSLPFLDGSHFLSSILRCIGNSQDERPIEDQTRSEVDIELGPQFGGQHTSMISLPIFSRFPHSFSQRFHASSWTWRRRIRRRKAGIERTIRSITIVLMFITALGIVLRT